MTGSALLGGTTRFAALGTTALVCVTDSRATTAAAAQLRADLTALDVACSRFRVDSEIRALERTAGTPVAVGAVLGRVLDAALRAAELTDGAVDPTIGHAMAAAGYDRDFAQLPSDAPAARPHPVAGWWRIHWDPARQEVLLPRGIRLDVGATAKALAADEAAARIAARIGCGALVALGGDVAVAGPPPAGGWRIAVADDHADPTTSSATATPVVTIAAGGVATSGTTRRRWRRGGEPMHHILDPRTGVPVRGSWRTVTVAAASCLDANTASTAAIVRGTAAPAWLRERDLPARLVAADGAVVTVAGWPARTEVRA